MNRIQPIDWRSVASLPEHAQRALLQTGDPVERVWATWALALRLGTRSVTELRSNLDSEPAPGIRCQLVVVLAGLGERSLVRVLATSDPDPTVRATACQYVIRTTPVTVEDSVAFAQERLRSDVPRIKQAILDEMASGRLALPDSTLADLLTDLDLETRSLALAIVRTFPNVPQLILAAVLQRVVDELDGELRGACIDLCIREGLHADLLKSASVASATAAHAVVTSLEKGGYRLSSRDLLLFGDHVEQRVLVALVDIIAKPLDDASIKWVSLQMARGLRLLATATKDESRDLTSFQWRATYLLYEALNAASVRLLDRAVVEALLEFVQSFDDDPDDEPLDLQRHRGVLELLRQALGAGSGLT
jgi:hypothetical protein